MSSEYILSSLQFIGCQAIDISVRYDRRVARELAALRACTGFDRSAEDGEAIRGL